MSRIYRFAPIVFGQGLLLLAAACAGASPQPSAAPAATPASQASTPTALPEPQIKEPPPAPCTTAAPASVQRAFNEPPPKAPYPVIKDLASSDIRISADSWPELVDKVKPTLTRGLQFLMICDQGGPDDVTFEFDNVFGYRTPGSDSIRWAIASGNLANEEVFPEDDPEMWHQNIRPHGTTRGTAMTANRRCDACGEPDHMSFLPTPNTQGRVYAVNWTGIMNIWGTGHPIKDTLLYVFRDPEGRWALLGEGEGFNWGKVGQEASESETVAEKVAPNPRAPYGIEIRFTSMETRSDPRSSRDTLVTYRDSVLDGTSPNARYSRSYLKAQNGQTFENVVHHLATWSFYWDWSCGSDTANKDHNRRIEQVMADRLRRLNPELKSGAIREGTRIEVPEGINPYQLYDTAPLKAALADLPKAVPALGPPIFNPDNVQVGAQYAVAGGGRLAFTVVIYESVVELTETLRESQCRALDGTPSGVTIYETPDQLGGPNPHLTIQIGIYRFYVGDGSSALASNAAAALASQQALREIPTKAR